jgi:hypothetical protein
VGKGSNVGCQQTEVKYYKFSINANAPIFAGGVF